MTDDEISEGSAKPGSPFQRFAMKLKRYSVIVQPNHIETVVAEVDVDGEPHLVKFSRYHDNQQFWTVPGERDERLRGRKTITVTEPEPDEYELYDLTLDPLEERNLAHSTRHENERLSPPPGQHARASCRAARRQAPDFSSRRDPWLPASRCDLKRI